MKRIHQLRTLSQPESFATFAAELRSRGERFGWLDWQPTSGAPEKLPQPLAEATAIGALRAVKIGEGPSAGSNQSVAVKSLSGPPVLKDVVREHFRGCLAVLISAPGSLKDAAGKDLPVIEAVGEDEAGDEKLKVEAGERTWLLTAEALCDRLRRPRPFD